MGEGWEWADTAHPVLSASLIGVLLGISFEEKAPLLKKFENPFTGEMSRMRPRLV